MISNKPFAEIIESSLNCWKAQCWNWDYVPPFGSLVTVTIASTTLFGVVYQSQTGSLDPVRQPYAYQKTEEELRAEQPQIFEFLHTTFLCAPLGFYTNALYYQLPPTPPKIHSFVQHASSSAIQQFFVTDQYLQVLFGLPLSATHIDELILALLQQTAQARLLTTEKLQDFMHTFSLLTGNDYRRLKLFLQRAQRTLTI